MRHIQQYILGLIFFLPQPFDASPVFMTVKRRCSEDKGRGAVFSLGTIMNWKEQIQSMLAVPVVFMRIEQDLDRRPAGDNHRQVIFSLSIHRSCIEFASSHVFQSARVWLLDWFVHYPKLLVYPVGHPE